MKIKNIQFNKYYKFFNLLSSFLIILSIILLLFKGLNFGIDFKGGTLIELRVTDKGVNISSLRNAFSNMNLGDVAIKKFGKDLLIKINFDLNLFLLNLFLIKFLYLFFILM